MIQFQQTFCIQYYLKSKIQHLTLHSNIFPEMKFKGQIIKIHKKQYTLKEQMAEGGFSAIFSTNNPQIICKAQVLSVPAIKQAYQKEKQILKKLYNYPSIVKLYDSIESKIGQNTYGFLFLQNCSNGTAFTQLQSTEGSLPEKDILRVFIAVTEALTLLHKQGISHRDIKLQNILRTKSGQYKLCDFGSSTREMIRVVDKNNRVQIQEFIEKTTTPLYRSPQQLDLYSGFQIGPKVDIFALGVMIFMLCFKKQPFQSRLSAINKQFFVPQDCVYSSDLLTLIEKCFETNPKNRINSEKLLTELKVLQKRKKALIELQYDRQLQKTSDQLARAQVKSSQINSDKNTVETSFFDKIKLMYTQYTTQTQGWIKGFMQDSEQAPPLKYNRLILTKCWQKRYKIEKVYQIIWNSAQQNISKSLVILKLLILLHNFLRKGPTQAIQYDKEYSPIRLATKLYKHWKVNQKSASEDDVKRNSFVCLLIRYYCLIIIGKSRFGYQNSNLFQGNYSIIPYLSKKQESIILTLPLIEAMLSFLQICTCFHQAVQNKSYLLEIQRSIILSIVDEQYCLLSTFVFIYYAFKTGINHVQEDLDLQKICMKLEDIEERFQEVYLKMTKLFQVTQKFSTLFEHNTFSLNKEVITKLRNIKVGNRKLGNFRVSDYLNYKNTICGLKIPMTYQDVVKNPNFLKDLNNSTIPYKNSIIQVEQFKLKKQQRREQQKPSKSNFGFTPISQKSQRSPPSDVITMTYNVTSNQQSKHQSVATFEQFEMISRNNQPLSISQNPQFFQSHNQNNILNYQKNRDNTKNIFHTMEFTHQNLNKDYLTTESPVDMTRKSIRDTNDKFKDFMSIVDQKFDTRKQVVSMEKQILPHSHQYNLMGEKNNQKQNFNSQNSANNNKNRDRPEQLDLMSVEHPTNLVGVQQKVQTSNLSSKTPVKRIQLINFFQDDQQQVNYHLNQQKKTSIEAMVNMSPKEHIKSPKKKEQDLMQMGDLNRTQGLQIKQNNQIMNEKKIHSEKYINENKSIDLKGFVIQQVRRSAQQYLITFQNLKFFEKVGNGHSSQVYRGQWRGRQVAIKKIKDNMQSSNSQKQFRREIMTSVKIRNHPQLVTLIGVAEYKNEYYIINEFCYGLTLFDLLHQSRDPLPWKIRLSIAKQIAKGIVYLHTNEPPIIHRDLKSLNVLLVNKFEEGQQDIQIKIADFGLSRDFASTYMTGTLGTYHWMAPQIFNNEPYSLKADVYSYGIVLWEIASRCPPYRNMLNPQALMKFVTLENGRPDITQIDIKCPLEIRMLMMRCWDRFPANRPNFSEILNVLNSVTII